MKIPTREDFEKSWDLPRLSRGSLHTDWIDALLSEVERLEGVLRADDEQIATLRTRIAQLEARPSGCPDAQLPDGPTCPKCGGYRAPSGVGGGSWVHAWRPE